MSHEGLAADWAFTPSPPSRSLFVRRAVCRLRRSRPAPPSRALKAISRHARWTLYFVYAPEGALRPGHLFTIERLKALDRKLLVICAAPSPDAVPAVLAPHADALYWKDLPGFDFSAYALGLRAIAEASEHADVLLLNDSVYGPFCSIEPLLARARFDLTGFTASSEIENHIQSYGFHLRDVSRRRLAGLRSIFPARHAFDARADVILCQETRMARVAAAHMTVGALWRGAAPACPNPTVATPLELLSEGFPFLKRMLLRPDTPPSLQARVRGLLAEFGHPPVDVADARVDPVAPSSK